MRYTILVTFRSGSDQQRARRVLAAIGIRSQSVRPSLTLSGGSCGYGLMVHDDVAEQAVTALIRRNVRYGKTFIKDNDSYREVRYGLSG